jgi:hypothetical protein
MQEIHNPPSRSLYHLLILYVSYKPAFNDTHYMSFSLILFQ